MMAAHKRNSSVCLACEMDSLFLQYYGRATGRDVVSILADLSASPRRSVMDLFDEISGRDEESTSKGEPLITAKMLHVAWKSGGMGHLAGYEQRDAHEFLHAFLDILGKQICQHRARVDGAIAMSRCGNPFVKQQEQVHHGKHTIYFSNMLDKASSNSNMNAFNATPFRRCNQTSFSGNTSICLGMRRMWHQKDSI